MARLESDHGRLLVSFQFNGARCREYLGLDDTRDNRRTGARTVNEIECELKAGKFDYAADAPKAGGLSDSGLARRLNRQRRSPPKKSLMFRRLGNLLKHGSKSGLRS
jgi:hypothetical protein